MNIYLAIPILAFLLAVIPGRAAEEPAAAALLASVVKRIEVEQYDALRANTNNVLLDVRTPAEFVKGHIPRAINVDINSSSFTEKLASLDTNKTYLVNCAVGMRSARACKKMESMGFKNLYDLGAGFDGWKKAGKPVEK